MQNNSSIGTSFDVSKRDVLKNQYGDFADKIMNFCNEQDFFKAVSNHKDLKIGDFYELLNEHKNMLSHEQICHLLINFFDISWNAYTENKNIDNAKNIIEVLLIHLTQLNEKQAYEYDFNSVKRCFEKIMNDVPGIKTHEYLSYISNKLSKTYLPPQFCFEIVLLFGDGIPLQADIKNLGWHAQFARFRLEIEKTLKQYYPKVSISTEHKNNFNADIRACFRCTVNMDSVYYAERPAANDAGKAISNKLIEYMRDGNVSLKTKLRTMVYMSFDLYYKCMYCSDREYVPYNYLTECKKMLLNNFQSPGDLLTAYAEIFPDLKYNFQKYTPIYQDNVSECCLILPYILIFLYSREELYTCIKNIKDESDFWRIRFLWKAVSRLFYKKVENASEVRMTNLFPTLDEYLSYFLKICPEIHELNLKPLEYVSLYINDDLFLYSIDEIKSFIEKTNEPTKLALLFYIIFDGNDYQFKIYKSPSGLLDIYTKLYPKIKNYLQKKDTDKLVGKCLANIFNAEQLAAALKKTNDLKEFRLLLNALNLFWHKDIEEIFDDPKDLFYICVEKYKSQGNNIEINENNHKCPEPLLNILKRYNKQKLAGLTEQFKKENDPLTKSWLSDLVDVKQNFFETYRNVLDFLNKNQNCPQPIKDNLNRLIDRLIEEKHKHHPRFDENDFLWLFGLGNDYCSSAMDRDAFVYSEDIEKRCEVVHDLFLKNYKCSRQNIFCYVQNSLAHHKKIWKAVLGLIIRVDEGNLDVKNIDLKNNIEQFCNMVDTYNSKLSRLNELNLRIQNLNEQINQILTLNWKWFTIILTFVYVWQLYQLKKELSNSITEKNRLQPLLDRLGRAEAKIKSFGLQTNNRDLNKKTPFQYCEEYQKRVQKLFYNMKTIIENPEQKKILNKNKNSEEINNPNIISTKSNEKH